MGNPKRVTVGPAPAADNLLARMRDGIADGKERLPPAGPGQPAQFVEVEDAYTGRVVVEYRCQESRRGRHRSWFWVACGATPAP
jgi:hypothetical protein